MWCHKTWHKIKFFCLNGRNYLPPSRRLIVVNSCNGSSDCPAGILEFVGTLGSPERLIVIERLQRFTTGGMLDTHDAGPAGHHDSALGGSPGKQHALDLIFDNLLCHQFSSRGMRPAGGTTEDTRVEQTRCQDGRNSPSPCLLSRAGGTDPIPRVIVGVHDTAHHATGCESQRDVGQPVEVRLGPPARAGEKQERNLQRVRTCRRTSSVATTAERK